MRASFITTISGLFSDNASVIDPAPEEGQEKKQKMGKAIGDRDSYWLSFVERLSSIGCPW